MKTSNNQGFNGKTPVWHFMDESAHFASYHIMIDWVRNRRAWPKSAVVIYGENMGYLTKPGIIGGAK